MNEATAVGILREHVPDLAAVYLFGSAANGATHAASDVDLAFLAGRAWPSFERFLLQERLAATLGRSVDLVDLRAASTVLRMQVVSTGRLLFSGDAAQLGLFEDLAYSAYARLNDERAAILGRVLSERTVYGR